MLFRSIDNTELKGLFDFTLDLTPIENDPLQARGAAPTAADPTNGFARLAAAVEDQLGLRLESRKIPVENLVVDKVERLSPN